jgi:hypothetical protein
MDTISVRYSDEGNRVTARRSIATAGHPLVAPDNDHDR